MTAVLGMPIEDVEVTEGLRRTEWLQGGSKWDGGMVSGMEVCCDVRPNDGHVLSAKLATRDLALRASALYENGVARDVVFEDLLYFRWSLSFSNLAYSYMLRSKNSTLKEVPPLDPLPPLP